MAAAAVLICIPTAVAGLAPNLPALLAIRACQGFLMPGLLTVAVPYVTERFRGPAAGAAMGAYTASLVFGGLVGRVGTAIVADLSSWRVALEALAIPTVAGAFAMYFWLPRDQPRHVDRDLRAVVAEHVRNLPLILNAVAAGATFFAFVGIFTFATHRLTGPPFDLSLGAAGLVYAVWVVGAVVPLVGHAAARVGPQRLLPFLLAAAGAGAALTLVDNLAAVIAGPRPPRRGHVLDGDHLPAPDPPAREPPPRHRHEPPPDDLLRPRRRGGLPAGALARRWLARGGRRLLCRGGDRRRGLPRPLAQDIGYARPPCSLTPASRPCSRARRSTPSTSTP